MTSATVCVVLRQIRGLSLCVVLCFPVLASAWELSIPAAQFARSELPVPGSAGLIARAGNLSGPQGGCCLIGWVEYDFEVPTTGWYELAVGGSGRQAEYLFNPLTPDSVANWSVYDSSDNIVDGLDKIGNVWLKAGANTLRVQRYYWTGLPRITRIVLRSSSTRSAGSVFARLMGHTNVFAAGACSPLEVLAGGLQRATVLSVETRDMSGQRTHSQDIAIPAGSVLRRHEVRVPCEAEGDYLISFRERTEGWLAWRDVRGVSYQVIASAASALPEATQRRELIEDIDLARRAPDYVGGGATRVISQPFGRYRETGSTGFTHYQRAPDLLRRAMPEPSWMAYSLYGLTPQERHEVEVSYPDDAERTVVLALREDAPLAYPLSSGFDTGGEFALSQGFQTESLKFWPRSRNVRLTIMNAHDGKRAAASRIRVYRLTKPLPDGTKEKLAIPATPRREVLHWYEEGSNFYSVVGTPDVSRHEWRHAPSRIGIERWVQTARESGATTLLPTASVYSFALYPSSFNRMFSVPETDDLRRLLLLARKYGMSVIPELHPRADELDWPYSATGAAKPNLLVSREGRNSYFTADGKTRNVPPYYNLLHQGNQDWYVGMIGELAQRYADLPALRGVSLRLMPWANPALNNFASLDWGYDDLSIRLFQQETGQLLPAALARFSGEVTPSVAEARYQWLMRNARESWIQWRCHKVAALFTRVRDRLRSIRPDLLLYTTLFSWRDDDMTTNAHREAGIDLALLGSIEGVVVIDAMGTYGRREPDGQENHRRRHRLLQGISPADAAQRPITAALMSANYVEVTDAVATPEQLGFAPATRRTWASAAVIPSGSHGLERYAVQLARSDALMLGDGGNGYAFAQPNLQAWLKEFKALPARHFQTWKGASEPVALRTLEDAEGLWLYAVNRERYPVNVTVALSGEGSALRLTSGVRTPLSAGRLVLRLDAYQLQAYRLPRAVKITQVAVTVAPDELARLRAQVDWLSELARTSGGRGLRLSPSEREDLGRRAGQARLAISENRFWQARMLVEHHAMRALYRKLGEQPPDVDNAQVIAAPPKESEIVIKP